LFVQLAMNYAIFAAVGYVASAGISARSGSAMAVLAFAIQTVVAYVDGSLQAGSQPWVPGVSVLIGLLLAAGAGAAGALLARARRVRERTGSHASP
jgi:hypothetical protein